MTGLIHVLTRGQVEICDRVNPCVEKGHAEICDRVNPCVDKGTRGQAEICDRVNPCGVDNGTCRNM